MTISATSIVPLLQEFCALRNNIRAIALSDLQGTLLAQVLPSQSDMETVGTVMSSTWMMAQESLLELGRKQIKQIFIKGKQGWIVLHVILDQWILLVFASHELSPRELFAEVQQLSNRMAGLLRG
jgi:predicted regulator of Ras-like GTPase activity (Roadblock/LC7/MglB family)